jgi:hypothetical protein
MPLTHAMTGAERQARYVARKKELAALNAALRQNGQARKRQPLFVASDEEVPPRAPAGREYDRQLLEGILALPKDQRPSF